MKVFSYQQLAGSDLIVDAVYEGGSEGLLSGEPISILLPGCGNMGGFRFSGRGADKRFVVLFTTGEDRDWPDLIDYALGQFIYFGDNKTPGHQLHETHKGGNQVLRRAFEYLHCVPPKRDMVPPFFIFSKHPTPASSRAVQFRGLAVPGYPGIAQTEDLVAVWKTTAGQRFQNYRATFSILDVPVISRTWIHTQCEHNMQGQAAPQAWLDWVQTGKYDLLLSKPATIIRSSEQQSPGTGLKTNILRVVFRYFQDDPILFERFAARIFQMQDQRVIIDEITRGVVDGGRDAIGRYRLGLVDDPVYVDFALEAKCYAPPIDGNSPNTVGVKEVSRLISRLRHRQFGVLVTTSVVARQAYQEVRDDRHPIIFISGKDIADTLIASGYNTVDNVRAFLSAEFPYKEREENF